MTRAQGLARTEELLRPTRDAGGGAARAGETPGDLVQRLGARPEVRELIHLRGFSAEPVLAELASRAGRPDPRREVYLCTLAYILDESRFEGALPALLELLER